MGWVVVRCMLAIPIDQRDPTQFDPLESVDPPALAVYREHSCGRKI